MPAPNVKRLAAFLIPVVLPLLPLDIHAQDDDDREWLEECRDDDYGDRARYCEVLVESVADPAASIAFDGGRNGGVQYVGWDQDRMEVHARIQAHADTEAEAHDIIRAVRLEIGSTGGRAVGPDDDIVVVYKVFVPRRRNLEATAQNGPVSARGVTGRIRLETRNGPISLKEVGGDVQVRAQNGPIAVALAGGTWEGEGLDAETRNGPVSVSIPAGYSAVLETGTVNGPFTTEMPLQVQIQPGESTRRFRATLGSGGPVVRVVTTNGPVSIRSR